jgi:hypothetical protein
MKATLRLTWWVRAVFLLFLAGCGNDKEEVKPKPSLTAIAPEAAAAGTTITITGTGFSSDPAKNVVTFTSSYDTPDGIVATVERATSTELVVRVPQQAFAQSPSAVIQVSTEGRPGWNSVVLKSNFFPEVFSVSPQPAKAGASITITGQNLNRDTSQIKILFFNETTDKIYEAYPTASTGTSLQVTVPVGMASGEINVFHYTRPDGSRYISQSLPITITP